MILRSPDEYRSAEACVMTEIIGKTYGEERALYGMSGLRLENCSFMGEEDGESALKECSDINAVSCDFALRYPLWHVNSAKLENCTMRETCRAAMWYCDGVDVLNSQLHGIKAVRECLNVKLDKCDVVSPEFGWKTRGLTAKESKLSGEYMFLDSSDITLENIELSGKYSFQYVKNAVIRNSVLNTKDAFWHSENVTVYDSVVNGEYLGWYSKGLKLNRCKISGTQPLCYAKGLVLEECTMTGCDLSFEKSSVHASVCGGIDSIKNPESGDIAADAVGEVISDMGREKNTVLALPSGSSVI